MKLIFDFFNIAENGNTIVDLGLYLSWRLRLEKMGKPCPWQVLVLLYVPVWKDPGSEFDFAILNLVLGKYRYCFMFRYEKPGSEFDFVILNLVLCDFQLFNDTEQRGVSQKIEVSLRRSADTVALQGSPPRTDQSPWCDRGRQFLFVLSC